MKILAICSSPKGGGKSNTELLLNHLAIGMREAGGKVRIVNLREKTVKTCLGCFNCWTKTPGRCIQEDDMTRELLPLIPASDLVVYATPLYNRTMNATMSNFRERQLPLLQPFSEKRDEKYARMLRRKLPPVVWLSVCGHPQESEFEALSQFLNSTQHPDIPIVAEIYRTSAEALKHPVFKQNLRDILYATAQAGRELVQSLEISKETLERIKQPLNNPQGLVIIGNFMWRTCINEHVTLEEFFKQGMKPRPDSLEGFMEISKYGLNTEVAKVKKVIVQFRFTGEVEASCYFTIENGTIKSTIGTSDSYDIAIETPFELWMDIMTGKADGGEMFMQRKYQVDGDPAMMLTLFKANATR
jgi:multimeric flavodoxin WrbA/putative sterol carrier protein